MCTILICFMTKTLTKFSVESIKPDFFCPLIFCQEYFHPDPNLLCHLMPPPNPRTLALADMVLLPIPQSTVHGPRTVLGARAPSRAGWAPRRAPGPSSRRRRAPAPSSVEGPSSRREYAIGRRVEQVSTVKEGWLNRIGQLSNQLNFSH